MKKIIAVLAITIAAAGISITPATAAPDQNVTQPIRRF